MGLLFGRQLPWVGRISQALNILDPLVDYILNITSLFLAESKLCLDS